MSELTQETVNAAWAAGLFEGEGCITRNQPNGCTLEMVSTDLDVLQKFLTIVKVGKIQGPIRNRNFKPYYKTQYRWRLSAKKDIIFVWDLIGPHMGIRRTAKFEEFRDRLYHNGNLNRKKRGPYGKRKLQVEQIAQSCVV